MDTINKNINARSEEKWGEAAKAGFQIIPDVLFRYQKELNLNASDMVALLNLGLHWWYKDMPPFPRTSIIAKRMGSDIRTVQRSFEKLKKLGYIKEIEFEKDSSNVQALDLSGLVTKLSELALHDPNYRPNLKRITQQEVKNEDLPF